METVLLVIGIAAIVLGVIMLASSVLRFMSREARPDMRHMMRDALAMTGLGVALVGVLIAASSLVVGGNDDGSVVGTKPTPSPTITDTPQANETQTATRTPTNRRNCDEIRGTTYLSLEERTWFLANCIDAAATPPPPAGSTPPPPPPTSTPGPPTVSVTITTPNDGASVPLGVDVSGQSSGVAAGQVPAGPPPWVYVVLKAIPGDPNQSWWVQPFPSVSADGSWSAFVFVGIESDPPGTPVEICAIVSSDRLSVGRYGGTRPPAIAVACVSVMR